MANLFSFILLLSILYTSNSQITGYIPKGATPSNYVAKYSYQFITDPNDGIDKLLLELTLEQNKWIGLGFASSSGSTETNYKMEGTYAWIFANFDWGTLPNKLAGTVKEYTLGNHVLGDPDFPTTITVKNAYSDVAGGKILHSIQILRPIQVNRGYTIPTAGDLCFIYAIGNEWYWQQTSSPPVHEDKGIVCDSLFGVSVDPTQKPSYYPTIKPTSEPTMKPTDFPTAPGKTADPTPKPTKFPTIYPTKFPTTIPTISPTDNPTKTGQTRFPTKIPTPSPSFVPTPSPTASKSPTKAEDKKSTISPTKAPTISGFIPNNTADNAPSRQLEEYQQILILVGGFLVLIICCVITFIWFARSSKKKRDEKQKKREKMEELAKKENEIYVADNVDAIPVTSKSNINNDIDNGVSMGGNTKKKKNKYESDDDDDFDDEFSGDADTDDELKKKYGDYIDESDEEDDYFKRKKAKENVKTIDDSDEDDDSDNDIPARYRNKNKGKKSKFASAPAKSQKRVIKPRHNKYADDSDDSDY